MGRGGHCSNFVLTWDSNQLARRRLRNLGPNCFIKSVSVICIMSCKAAVVRQPVMLAEKRQNIARSEKVHLDKFCSKRAGT